MNTSYTINSYLPENKFLTGKRHIGARICKEDCAVIDAFQNYTILAARGTGLTIGADFRKIVGMKNSTERSLSKALQTKQQIVLSVDETPWLLFAHWLPATGLLLAIRPNCLFCAIPEALAVLNRSDFTFLSTVSVQKPSSEDCKTAYDVLSDILYQISYLLPRDLSYTADRLIAHVAAFAGYCIDFEAISSFAGFRADPQTMQRIVPFLLCSFLYLRGKSGALTAENTPHKATLHCRVSLSNDTRVSKTALPEPPIFANAVGLRGCEIQNQKDSLQVTFSIPYDNQRLSAGTYSEMQRITIKLFPLDIAS